jgi:hypothetical protein
VQEATHIDEFQRFLRAIGNFTLLVLDPSVAQ